MQPSEDPTRLLIAQRLKELHEANGGNVTPEIVVEDAKAEASVLHTFFQWDDAKAAHQHRLDQARRLIRSVTIEVKTEERTIIAPAYIRDPRVPGDEQGYRHIASVRTSEDDARDAVHAEFQRAYAALTRAHNVADVLGIGDEIDDVRVRVERLRERVAANSTDVA